MWSHLKKSKEWEIDWLLLATAVGLMAISVAFVYSATAVQDVYKDQPWYRQFAFQQIVWFGIGSIAVFIFCLADYRVWSRWAMVIYWITIILLILVLIIGTTKFGAKRWINLKIFQFQPSEFSKLAFILATAQFLSRPADELKQPAIFWKGIGLMALPFFLILKEPDLGSALVLIPIGFVMMLIAGVPIKFLGKLVGGAVLLVALILVDVLFAPPGWQIKLEDYQRRRLLVYFGQDYVSSQASPAEKRQARIQQFNDSYNVRQALIAVGSGGFLGKGWCNSDQIRLGFLPPKVVHNDFIFSVIAEEKGFMGSVTVISLYTLLLFAGIRTAGQTRDRLGKLLAVGVVTLFFSHIFVNIGMNIRLMPVTGIPLPLLSYGGSSVLCSLIALGILQNVYRYRKAY